VGTVTLFLLRLSLTQCGAEQHQAVAAKHEATCSAEEVSCFNTLIRLSLCRLR
jgi:hypothetical protein